MKNQLNIILRTACEAGLDQGVYSGVSAAVSMIKKGKRLRARYSGGVTRTDGGVSVKESTLFDLASLTKPLCTTLCTLHYIDKGYLQWQSEPLSMFDEKISSDKKNITIEHILHHSSGLLNYKNYFVNFLPLFNEANEELLIKRILKEPLIYKTGEKSLYSDLGFILLGKILEMKKNESLNRIFTIEIFDQIRKKNDVTFLPLSSSKMNRNTIVATEYCPWRKKTLHGEVHDEHCWLFGGVAGHAGLFGTAEGVLAICERLLDCWHDRDTHPAFSNDTLHYALTKRGPDDDWLLGFDTPSSVTSSSGRYFSKQSIGHLGFTGTSFWIDLKEQVIVVLLTNRVHPTRENLKIRTFRPYFHDVIMEEILA